MYKLFWPGFVSKESGLFQWRIELFDAYWLPFMEHIFAVNCYSNILADLEVDNFSWEEERIILDVKLV